MSRGTFEHGYRAAEGRFELGCGGIESVERRRLKVQNRQGRFDVMKGGWG